jgi:hypothetical protein
MSLFRSALLTCALLTCAVSPAWAAAPASAPPGAKLPAFADLPDWSGVWIGSNGLGWSRETPPLTPEWTKKYQAYHAMAAIDRLPDPVSFCGTPSGFPRLMSIPDGYEFVVRPEQTWILTENGPNVMRVYTDTRGHLGPDDTWDTYMGDSVGHWEGQTLVFDTVALNGDPHTVLDRSGLTYSNKAHVTTRIHLTDKDTLEASVTIDDPLMLTKPWTVVKHYKRQPPGARIYDYVCTENNRNPITATGQTLTLGTDGKPIDKTVDPAGK